MQSFAAEQPTGSRSTTVYEAGSGARMHAHRESAPGIAPWVVLRAEDRSTVSLVINFEQAQQALSELERVLDAERLRGDAA